MNSMSIGVATIGSNNVAAHIESIGLVDDLHLVGIADAGQVRKGKEMLYENAEAAIADAHVGIVALCTPPLETGHWIRAASDAGKVVVAELPIGGNSRQSRELVGYCATSGTPIFGIADLVYSKCVGGIACGLDESIGSPLYLECGITVPQGLLANDGTGVLSSHGCGLLALIAKFFGPIDSVYARSRSLRTNRPSEDIAVAQLRFYDGLEGVVIVNGLGDEEKTVVRLHGSRGRLKIGEDRIRFSDGLRAQYSELASHVHGATSSRFGESELANTHFLLDWIQHSARQNIEVSRKEAAVAIGR